MLSYLIFFIPISADAVLYAIYKGELCIFMVLFSMKVMGILIFF